MFYLISHAGETPKVLTWSGARMIQGECGEGAPYTGQSREAYITRYYALEIGHNPNTGYLTSSLIWRGKIKLAH